MNLIQTEILKILNKLQGAHLPTVWKELGVTGEEFSSHLSSVCHLLPNPRLVNGLFYTDYKEPFYTEICNSKFRRGNIIPFEKSFDYVNNNMVSDQHISVFAHDQNWVKNLKKSGGVNCSNSNVFLPFVVIDLDREKLCDCIEEVKWIYNSFPFKEYMEIWFSGNRGFHILVNTSIFGSPVFNQNVFCGTSKLYYYLMGMVTKDSRHQNGVVYPEKLKRKELRKEIFKIERRLYDSDELPKKKKILENFDPALASLNSLIRQPNSINEKSCGIKFRVIPELIDYYDFTDHKQVITDYNRVEHKKPLLIHWVYKALEMIDEKKETTKRELYSSSVYEDFYLDLFEDLDTDSASETGWIKNLFSPFYEDSNPSVSVNILNGFYKDFGTGESYNFIEIYSKVKKVNFYEAKTQIEKR